MSGKHSFLYHPFSKSLSKIRKEEVSRQKCLQRKKILDHIRSLLTDNNSNQSDDNCNFEDKMIDDEIYTSKNEIKYSAKNNITNENKRCEVRKSSFSSEFMIPNWMIDIPDDINDNYIIYARPNGQRCLLTAIKNKTFSKKVNGKILHTFSSILPSGAFLKNKQVSNNITILDAIYHSDNKTYYIKDVLIWNSVSFYDCEAEFRLFWIKNKLSELNSTIIKRINNYRLEIVPFMNCNRINLLNAYKINYQFVKDGIQFLHKFSRYIRGPNPLFLTWKDPKTSLYYIDTSDGCKISKNQVICLSLNDKNELTSLDGVKLGELSNNTILKEKLKASDLIRLTISGLNIDNCKIVLNDLKYFKQAKRTMAELLSKIIFQNNARNGNNITIENLVSSLFN